jgi:elongation factor G
MAYTTSDIRNLALIGHVAAGKTLLAEALLHRSGAIRTMGDLSRGTTVCDSDTLAKELQHSTDSAVCHLDWQGKHINLIDTPGYPDLLGRSQGALAAVETAAIVVDAASGLGIATRRMNEAAMQRGLDRLIIVTKIDQPGIDLAQLLAELQQAFGSECLPINLPAEGGRRVIDCFFSREGPDTDFSSVEQAHRAIIEQVIEIDTELLERYLGGDESISAEQLHDPFERALREGHLIPVCFTSSTSGAGINELLELIARLMPCPLEANPPNFVKGEAAAIEAVKVEADPARHALAHVFKVTIDTYQGRVSALRVHQGTLRAGMQLFVGDQRKPFRISHLFQLQGAALQEVSNAIPGDICAVTKVDELHIDTVVHDSHDEDHYHLRPPEPFAAMQGIAIGAARHGDEQKIADALHKLLSEDPSLRLEHVPSVNETVLYGRGELHLRVALERMKRQSNVALQTHVPSVPFRETVLRTAEGHHLHKKQTGGAGQYGEVYLRIEPLPRGGGFEFVDAVKGGTIPSQYIPAVEKGVRQVLQTGAVAGFPMQDVRVVVYDGKTHPVDSKEVAFITAGRKAFLDAISNAQPIVLEPIVNLSITAPSTSLGVIAGDLSSIRARINGQTVLPDGQAQISVQVPLAELKDYAHRLKAMTSGEGIYTTEFSHYEPAQARLQQELVSAYSRRHREASES